LNKKTGMSEINSGKWRLSLVALICIFSLISVSAAFSEKGPWVVSIEKSGEKIVFADHSESPTEGGWILLSGGKEVQLPQPLNFTYYGVNRLEREGTTIEIKQSNPESNPKSNQGNNTELVFTYPYSTHPFYTEGQNVTMGFNGSSDFKKQNVEIYLIKGFDVRSAGEVLIDLVDNETISLEEALNKSADCYTTISATLDKKGDLAEPITFDSLEPGSYGILITLADDKDKKDEFEKGEKSKKEEKPRTEKQVLSATCFEVLDYELEADAVDTLEEGKDLEVDLSLKDAPAEGNFTYGAALIKKEAYKADINLSANGTRDGTDIFINEIGIARDLGINSTNYESKLNRNELSNNIQTLIGEGNGTISIGEENQNTLSLTTLDLLPGDYLLFTGAYEPGKGIVGIGQKELTIFAAGTSQAEPEQNSEQEQNSKSDSGSSFWKNLLNRF
jgi:methanogen extracellular protein (TIGR04279 family)